MATLSEGIKGSSGNLILFTLRLISGSVIGLTIALMGETLFDFGTFSFFLVLVVVSGLFLRQTKSYSWGGVFMLDLIFVLLAYAIRAYVMYAPGA